jgi:hypothetical protein
VTAENRARALELARGDPDEAVTLEDAQVMVKVAEVFRKYLDGTTVRLAWTVTVDGAAVPLTISPGGTMPTIAVAATVDNNTVTFAVTPTDDHNDPTGDTLTVTSDDAAGAVGTLVVNDDTHGGVVTLAHAEGSFNVTFADPAAPTVEDLVFAVTVGAGATSALSGTATVA